MLRSGASVWSACVRRLVLQLHIQPSRSQDLRVHVKHTDGDFEYLPYFCLPANELNDVRRRRCSMRRCLGAGRLPAVPG